MATASGESGWNSEGPMGLCRMTMRCERQLIRLTFASGCGVEAGEVLGPEQGFARRLLMRPYQQRPWSTAVLSEPGHVDNAM